MARKDDHLETHSRGHRGCDVGGGHPEGGWVSADGSCGLRSLGDQERLGWAGIAGAGRGGVDHSPSHMPQGFTRPLTPLFQIGGLRALPAPVTRALPSLDTEE